MIKILSLFSGIGAFEKALTRLGIKHEVINYCEIDKYASKAYSLIHNISEDKNLGDITKVDETKLDNFDLMTYAFPCQDISVAGYKKGITESTRSGLLFEALRILKHKKPKYAIAENVKSLVGKRFKGDFDNLLEKLDSYGYNNYWKVLNAKDFGIPQNRERVFIISIRKDVDDGKFEFPEGQELAIRLKDILEEQVEEKYYLSEKMLEKFYFNCKKNVVGEIDNCNFKQERLVYSPEAYAPTITSLGSNKTIKILLCGNLDIKGNDQIKRVYNSEGIGPTLTTMGGGHREPKIVEFNPNMRIRKLTPKECWRLMGFDDEDIQKCIDVRISNTQLYKMAGNSIVVDVLEAIFNKLIKGVDTLI